MGKRLRLLLCTLALVFGVNVCIDAQFAGGSFGALNQYLKVINTTLLPSADNTFDLGSAAKSWKDAHVEGTLTAGTLSVGAITTSEDLTFSNADPNIIGGDTDGALSVAADTATNQGGSIKLYGNTHATLAQDLEFYADATMVLSWDESEANWDFDGENVTGIGALEVADSATLGMLVHKSEALTATDAGVVASLTVTLTILTSEDDEADADAVSLADGTIGQIKIFVFQTEINAGDTIVITPATPVGFATITFDAVGDSVMLIFDGTSWMLLSNNNATIG